MPRGVPRGAARTVQDRFDTRRLADRIDAPRATRSATRDRDFIESRDMFFLATADAEGRPQCSYKGGDPGFVRVIDERTIAFPVYDGNGMFLSLGNLRLNAHVGMLFIDFERGPPARQRRRQRRLRRSVARRIPGSPDSRPGTARRGLRELSPLHPPCSSWSGHRSCPPRRPNRRTRLEAPPQF